MRRMLAAIVATAALAGVGVAQSASTSRTGGSAGMGHWHGHHHGHNHWHGSWGWYDPYYVNGYGYSPYAEAAASVSASQLMDAEARLSIAQSDRQRLLRTQKELTSRLEAQRSASGRAWAESKKAEPPKRANRFGDSDWNRITGSIAWPSTLESSDFDDARRAVDDSFRRLAERGGGDFTSAERADLRQLADRLQATLSTKAREMPANQYISALRFIDGVRDAAKYSQSTT